MENSSEVKESQLRGWLTPDDYGAMVFGKDENHPQDVCEPVGESLGNQETTPTTLALTNPV